MSSSALQIARRFRGPPESGNGGYVCGLLAEQLGVASARVRLLLPPPLEQELRIESVDGSVRLLKSDRCVAQAWPEAFDLEILPSPGIARAREMSRHYRGFDGYAFDECFVCGTQRAVGDGLRVFAGNPAGASPVACVLELSQDLADASNHVASRFVWAALDCPGAWSFLQRGGVVAVLGGFGVRLRQPVPVDEPLVVQGWEISQHGRKHIAGSALYNASGTTLACGLATWIEVDPAQLQSA